MFKKLCVATLAIAICGAAFAQDQEGTAATKPEVAGTEAAAKPGVSADTATKPANKAVNKKGKMGKKAAKKAAKKAEPKTNAAE